MSASKILRNESGVAMLMALTTITVLAVLAAELIYETEIYHKIVYNNVDQLRAHNLAKSGLKLARLQVLGAKKANDALQQLGKNAPVKQSDVDMIWQTPLMLPPPLPPGSSMILKDSVKKLTDELDLGGNIIVSISGESGKLNLNRLVWKTSIANPPSTTGDGSNNSQPTQPTQPTTTNTQTPNGTDPIKEMRKKLAEALENLLKQKRDASDEFHLKYEAITGENLIGNIVAWIDPKTEIDGESAPKIGYYRELQPPIAIKNAPLFSLSELHMVKDFDDTLVDFLSSSFTAMITEGLNINTVDKNLIKALFPSISDDNLKKLEEKRKLTGFNKPDDFWNFMKELGFGPDDKKQVDDSGITIVTTETAFRVTINAKSGDATKAWEAHLGPMPPKLSSTIPGQQPPPQQPQQIDPNKPDNNDPNKPQTNTSTQNDNGGPVVVYLKTD